jgi:hypothetical protein
LRFANGSMFRRHVISLVWRATCDVKPGGKSTGTCQGCSARDRNIVNFVFAARHFRNSRLRQYANIKNNAVGRKPAVTNKIPTAIPTLSTMLELLMTLPTLLDVGRLPEFKVADCKPEVHCVFGMDSH